MVLNTRLVFTILLAVLIGIVLLFIADVASQDEVMTFREHMHGHLDEVSAVKAGVVAGDLDAARRPATWLAEHEEPGSPSTKSRPACPRHGRRTWKNFVATRASPRTQRIWKWLPSR
jgi:hypothetical protein